MDGNVVAIITCASSVVAAILVAYLTAKWQVSSDGRVKASERRFDTYDQAIEMIVQLERDPSLSLDDAFLLRWYLLMGNLRAYASKRVVDAVAPFVNALRENYETFTEAQERLWGRWFESERIYSEDGMYSDISYTLVGGEYWEYEEELSRLRSQSVLSSDIVRASAEEISGVVRKDCGLD